MRDYILSEIRRLAEASGRAPGRRVFERETGIREADWYGTYWARWSDALKEAGISPNEKQGRLDREFVLRKLAQAARHYGRFPTHIELRMYRKLDPEFPSHNTFYSHFPTTAAMLTDLSEWIRGNSDYRDLATIMPAEDEPGQLKQTPQEVKQARQEGFVYLIRSGAHFKIGRSDELERRVKEIKVALPEAAVLEHAIRTDDPAGIEAYWHRRFSEKRANGEWFKLAPIDVIAFKRRRYQ